MKKRRWIIGLIFVSLLLIGMVGCSNDQGTTDPTGEPDSTEPEVTTNGTQEPGPVVDPLEEFKTTVSLNSGTEGIKTLGVRTLESTTQLNADWTGSGLEFVYDCKGGNLTLRTSATDPCYFRVYVDGQAWNNAEGSPYFMVNGTKNMVVPNIPTGVHTVRVVKATGHTLAQAHFYSMTFYGTLLKDQKPADKDLYIEFVGDSICCGWGVIGEHQGKYSDQDGTLAYPYLVAEAMNADYSITALSGQGLLMGNPGMTKGYLLGSPLRDGSAEYGFQRKADIVVINIGTNDYGYSSQYGITEEAFKEAYLNFVRTVYKKNGESCKIYCLYNTMNDTYANAILEVCEMLGGESAGLFTVRMDRTASGHPTIAEDAAYAEKLTAYLNETKDREVTSEIGLPSGTLVGKDHGDGLDVSYSDPAWNS